MMSCCACFLFGGGTFFLWFMVLGGGGVTGFFTGLSTVYFYYCFYNSYPVMLCIIIRGDGAHFSVVTSCVHLVREVTAPPRPLCVHLVRGVTHPTHTAFVVHFRVVVSTYIFIHLLFGTCTMQRPVPPTHPHPGSDLDFGPHPPSVSRAPHPHPGSGLDLGPHPVCPGLGAVNVSLQCGAYHSTFMWWYRMAQYICEFQEFHEKDCPALCVAVAFHASSSLP